MKRGLENISEAKRDTAREGSLFPSTKKWFYGAIEQYVCDFSLESLYEMKILMWVDFLVMKFND